MWNILEIRKKQKYVLQKLRSNVTKEEQEKLELSLISYISMLSNSGTLYTKFYNFMDRITKDRFSLYRNAPYIQMEQKLVSEQIPKFDDNYLNFLITLATNIASTSNDEQLDFIPLNLSGEDLVKISSNFYLQLGDQEIMQNAFKILGDSTSLNITNTSREGFEDFGGITYNDYIFNKSYCTMKKSNTIYDAQILNHEVMHGIDFYMHPKIPSKNYFGFHEVPTYTIDYLMLDYLEQIGFNSNEVNKLRTQKSNYLSSLASLTLTQIKGLLIRTKGIKASLNPSINDINDCLTPQLKKQLLEIQSGVIAYGLSQQIVLNRELGLNNLKKFMKSLIPKDKRPNFESIGLTDEKLLELSKMISIYSIEYGEVQGRSR